MERHHCIRILKKPQGNNTWFVVLGRLGRFVNNFNNVICFGHDGTHCVDGFENRVRTASTKTHILMVLSAPQRNGEKRKHLSG